MAAQKPTSAAGGAEATSPWCAVVSAARISAPFRLASVPTRRSGRRWVSKRRGAHDEGDQCGRSEHGFDQPGRGREAPRSRPAGSRASRRRAPAAPRPRAARATGCAPWNRSAAQKWNGAPPSSTSPTSSESGSAVLHRKSRLEAEREHRPLLDLRPRCRSRARAARARPTRARARAHHPQQLDRALAVEQVRRGCAPGSRPTRPTASAGHVETGARRHGHRSGQRGERHQRHERGAPHPRTRRTHREAGRAPGGREA